MPIPAPMSAATRLALTQAGTCASLCAAGAAGSMLLVLTETGRQCPAAASGVIGGAAAVSAGALAGLWIPRRIIRRRLQTTSAPQAGRTPLVADSDFAASLAGSLVLLVALLWCALLGWVAEAESLRGLIAQRLLLPTALRLALLLSVPAAGLVLQGLLGSMLLVSLHGWYRALSFPRMPIAWLWVCLLGGAAGGAQVVRLAPAGMAALGCALAMFLAAWIAGLRPRRIGPTRPVSPAIAAAGWRQSGWPMALVLAAAALVALAHTHWVYQHGTGREILAAGGALTGCGALAGPLLVRLRAVRSCALGLAGVAWLVSAALVARIEATGEVAGWSLLALSAGASLTIVLSAQALAIRVGSVQQALTTCGLLAAAGFGLGLMAGAARPPARPQAPRMPLTLPGVLRDALALPATGPCETVRDAGRLASIDLDLFAPRVLLLDARALGFDDAGAARRLMQRALRALGPSGRLVVAGATHGWLEQALAQRQLWPSGWRGYRLAADEPVLLFGPDVPAWLSYARQPGARPVELASWPPDRAP